MSDPSNSLNYDPCPRWEEYPLENAMYSTPGKDLALFQNLLVRDQSHLFESYNFEFEILRLQYDGESRWQDGNVVLLMTLFSESNCPVMNVETVTSMNSLDTQLRVSVPLDCIGLCI